MKAKLILFIILFCTFANAQFYEKVGVRNSAMGEVGIASTDDATASFWNPALLSSLSEIELNSFYTKYFWELENDDLSYTFAVLSFPLGRIGNFAFSGGQFNANIYKESKFGFHYGNSFFKNKFMIGTSLHYYEIGYIQNEYTINDPFFNEFGYTTNTFDFDVGIAYKLTQKIQLGIVSKNNLEANISLNQDDENKLSRNYGLGLQYQLSNKILIASDAMFITTNDLQVNEIVFGMGVEYKVNKYFEVRSGANVDKVTGGFGINVLKSEYINKYRDGFSGEEYINVKSFAVAINYSFQYSFSEIETKYGNHFVGIEIRFGNSTKKVNQLSDYVPPKTEYVTKVKADNLQNEKVKIDTALFEERVIIDTVFVETIKVVRDTVIQYTKTRDLAYIKKVNELNSLKIKLKDANNNNRAHEHLLKALELYYQRNYPEAIKECKVAIRIAPNLTLSYIRLGSVYLKTGNTKKAKFYYQKAAKMDPNNPEIKKIRKYLKLI